MKIQNTRIFLRSTGAYSAEIDEWKSILDAVQIMSLGVIKYRNVLAQATRAPINVIAANSLLHAFTNLAFLYFKKKPPSDNKISIASVPVTKMMRPSMCDISSVTAGMLIQNSADS